MCEEFPVAFGANDGGWNGVDEGPGGFFGDKAADFFDGLELEGFVANDASAAHLFAGEFKLGFDEHDKISLWIQQSKDRGENQGQGNKADIGDREMERRREVAWLEETGIDAFVNNDAGILSESPVELAVADIKGVDAGGSVLEQAVGESSSGGTDIDADFVFDSDLKGGEGVFEFEAAASDVFFGLAETDGSVAAEFASRLSGGLSGDFDFTRHDEALGFFAGFREAELADQLVEPDFFGVVGLRNLLHIWDLPVTLCSPNPNSSRVSNRSSLKASC